MTSDAVWGWSVVNKEGPKGMYLTFFWQGNPQATLATSFVLGPPFPPPCADSSVSGNEFWVLRR